MMHERRLFPRYYLNLPVTLKIQSQGEARLFETQSVNISSRAVEVHADLSLAQALLKQDAYPRTCELTINLQGEEQQLTTQVQLVHHRRLSQHSFRLVLLFAELSPQDKTRLLAFLGGQRARTTRSAPPPSSGDRSGMEPE